MIAAPLPGTDVDGAYALVLESSTLFATLYDVGFNEMVATPGQMAR